MRDIARLIGVSVPAVQVATGRLGQWGESNERRRRLAACHMISEHYMVQDVAQWFESPILLGVPVTPLDLYAARHVDLVFRLASGKTDPEAVLGVFDPESRETYRSDFEVFEAEDGLALAERICEFVGQDLEALLGTARIGPCCTWRGVSTRSPPIDPSSAATSSRMCRSWHHERLSPKTRRSW